MKISERPRIEICFEDMVSFTIVLHLATLDYVGICSSTFKFCTEYRSNVRSIDIVTPGREINTLRYAERVNQGENIFYELISMVVDLNKESKHDKNN